ncbi:MAG TPA: hypothetical protein VHQ03_00405 [Candidatus Dormibacteraeota bacterium]|nr:hypothetical protein [Candidatus Dormibacteraeota bacterium]
MAGLSRSRDVGILYELVKTVQLNVSLGDDSFALKVELFQEAADNHRFHADIWRNELFRIQSTFPQDPSSGRPLHNPSDEMILIDWSTNLVGDYSVFNAESAAAALDTVVQDIQNALDKATDGKVESRR